MIYLLIYITDNCKSCEKVVNSTKKIVNNYSNVSLQVLNIEESLKPISIVPAIYINNELFSYGELDENRLISIISAK